jgi:pyruvate-formate lyase
VINFEGTLLDTANDDFEEQEEPQTQDLALDELNQEELTHDASLKIDITTESSIDEKNKTHD